MAAVNPIHRLTEAEYLEIERRAEFKSEFFDGEMFAMAGGSPRHSLIAANLIFALKLQLKGGPCRVYTSDLRLKVQASGLYTYPDVSVVCGQEQLEDEHEDVFLNPTVIFEILSDSREAYDRGRKFELYRGLASLREYVLVSQHKPLIENYVRQDSGAWLLHETTGLKGKVILPSLGITLELTDVYSDIRFVPIRLHPT
jgi:Uma2 family endonuclease